MKAVLFDLDGTLLPMDQDEFTKGYFKLLAKKLAARGYEPAELVKNVWASTAAMVRNDGHCSNEEAFWDVFTEIYGWSARNDIPVFNAFYANEFQQAQTLCGYTPRAAEIVHWLKAHGLRVALATNPLFPAIATESRIRWAGLEPEEFELYTTYENIGYCKPNLDYYREILRRMALQPEDCLMVGNDIGEDMIAEKLGMKVFLLTDCIINKVGEDIDRWPHGGFDELADYLRKEFGLC